MNINKIIRTASLLLLVICSMFVVSCGTTKSGSFNKGKAEMSKDTLSAEEKEKYDYFYLDALRLKLKGDYDGAFEMLKHCLEINPNGSAALYEMSRFYVAINDMDNSEKMLKKAVKEAPDNYWYKQTLASYYQKKGDYPQAINIFEDMASDFPTKLDPLLALADLYNTTKQYDEVIKTLDKIEQLDGKSEQLSMEKFRIYINNGDSKKAFAEIEDLAKEHPYDMRYQTLLGDLYLENDKDQEAYNKYMKVLESEPHYAPARLSLSSYYKKIGNDSLYNVQMDSVLLNDNVESDTKMDVMRQLIISSEQTDKDSTKIASMFTNMLKRKQPNADIAMLAAQYFVTKKMDKEAIPVLDKVLSLDPLNTPARLQLLTYALKEENPDKVIEICKPATEYTPEVLEFYLYLGLSYHQKSMDDDAIKVLEKGTNQVTDKSDKGIVSDLYAIMGDLYHTKELPQKAFAAYDSSLVYKDDNINTLNNYAYYLSKDKKDLDRAEEMSYKTVKAEPNNGTYLDTYAWILFGKGKYTEAKLYIDQALKNDGDKSSVVVEHAGDIYFKAGEKEKALEFWKQAEKLGMEQSVGESEQRTKEEMRVLKKKISTKKYFEK